MNNNVVYGIIGGVSTFLIGGGIALQKHYERRAKKLLNQSAGLIIQYIKITSEELKNNLERSVLENGK